MTLKEYMRILKKIAKEHGTNLKVVYARDDEGNKFELVHYSPSVGKFEVFSENVVCVN